MHSSLSPSQIAGLIKIAEEKRDKAAAKGNTARAQRFQQEIETLKVFLREGSAKVA